MVKFRTPVNEVVIKSERQENGLFGMPVQCYKMDKMAMSLSKENWEKHSAICIAIAEFFTDETFEIFWSDEDGFFVKLSESGMRRVRYNDFDLRGNLLKFIA